MPPGLKKAEDAPSLKRFIPVVGRLASMQLDTDEYVDVTVEKIYNDGYCLIKYSDDTTEDVLTELLDVPLESDVNERFAYFAELASLVLHRKLKALFVTGEGGIGKSYTLQEVIEMERFIELGDGPMIDVPIFDELGEPVFKPMPPDKSIDDWIPEPLTREMEKYDFVRIKGYTTARALFDFLEVHKDKMVVIEDCDSALTDPTAQNVFKAILDTFDRRRVTWMTKNENKSFDFTGSVIFLSNLAKEKINQAIISRSIVVDLQMSREDVIERMTHIMPSLPASEGLTPEEQRIVLALLDKYRHTVQDLNLRTLVKAMGVYKETRNEKLTRYAILNN